MDLLQGRQTQRLESASGDFVIRRRDGLIAYQLAVVVDDAISGITEIVRGIDIMDSTPRQIWLQRLLGYATPAYAHIPVITHADGDKLSKLTGAPAIPVDEVRPTLVKALAALRQARTTHRKKSMPSPVTMMRAANACHRVHRSPKKTNARSAMMSELVE